MLYGMLPNMLYGMLPNNNMIMSFLSYSFHISPFVTYYNIVMGRSPASKGGLTETVYRLYVDFGR